MNTRLLGTLCMIGGLINIADSVRIMMLGVTTAEGGLQSLDSVTMITGVLGTLCVLCGLLGFIALRATGHNPIFRLLTYLPGVSYVAGIVVLLGLLTGLFTRDSNNPLAEFLFALFTLVLPATWLVVAILTIAAKSWSGWRRFVPLALFLAFPLGIAASLATGLGGSFGIIGGASTILLGYAVQSSATAAELHKATV